MTDVRSDRDAELAVLAACLSSPLALTEARKHLIGADFDDPRHETIWDAMLRLARAGKAVDATTVAATVPPHIKPLLVDVVTALALPDNIREYAAIVHAWAVRRRLHSEASEVLRMALNPEVNPVGFAASVVTRFTAVRDSGALEDDMTALTLAELLEQEDDEPDWLIPGLLERRDRLMLTGQEGLGKSYLLRQFAILAAAGVTPWDDRARMKPIRSLVYDCENSWSQVRRKARPLVQWAQSIGADPVPNVMVECTSRIDITRDRDLAKIHRLVDAFQPDLVVIGPVYRLAPRALQTDDEAGPVLAALDTLRDRGIALLIEAHAGHAVGSGGVREMRPRGSSALLGWPEFGLGMRHIGTEGYCDLVEWRGNRDERNWPERLRRADGFRWVPHIENRNWNPRDVA